MYSVNGLLLLRGHSFHAGPHHNLSSELHQSRCTMFTCTTSEFTVVALGNSFSVQTRFSHRSVVIKRCFKKSTVLPLSHSCDGQERLLAILNILLQQREQHQAQLKAIDYRAVIGWLRSGHVANSSLNSKTVLQHMANTYNNNIQHTRHKLYRA